MLQACTQCPVRESAICHSLDADQLGELGGAGRRQSVQAGQTLIWEGDDSLLVGNVIEGVLKLTHSTPDGRDQTLGLVYPGDFIGRAFVKTARQTVVALTDASVCTFRRSAFDSFARAHPALEHDLLHRTLDELDRVRDWMVLLGRMSAHQRLAAFFLELADRLGVDSAGVDDAGEDTAVKLDLPFGRQEIADILGLTIETVSRQITRMRGEGLIDTPSQRVVMILDRTALEDLCA
jgi:CRP/FNR family transcriptional regulator